MSGIVKIPGLTEVIERECDDLEGAFFPQDTVVCGFRLVPMNCVRLALLLRCKCPFFTKRAKLRDVDIVRFLWIMRPGNPLSMRGRRWYWWKYYWTDTNKLIIGIDRYLADTFEASPSSMSSGGDGKKIPVGYIAGVTHRLMAAYGWDYERASSLPLVQAFQYLLLIQADANPGGFQALSRADKYASDKLAEMERESRRKREEGAGV